MNSSALVASNATNRANEWRDRKSAPSPRVEEMERFESGRALLPVTLLALVGAAHSTLCGCTAVVDESFVRLLVFGSLCLINFGGPSGPVGEDSDLVPGHGEEATLDSGDEALAVHWVDGHDAVLGQLADQWLVTRKHADLTLGGLSRNQRGLSRPQHALDGYQFSGDVSHVPLPTSR